MGTGAGTGGTTTYGYSLTGSYGSLSPATFVRGTASVRVSRLAYNSSQTGRLTFSLFFSGGTVPSDGLIGSESLILTLGSATFAIPSPGTDRVLTFSFDPSGLSWSSGDTVSVSLSSGLNTPPTPTVATVAVTSTPTAATDTYGQGETIDFTVTFSEAVEVSSGRPHFEFSLSDVDTAAAYQRGSGTTTLVFAYTVLAADEDTNGIWIGDETRTIKLDSGEYIRSVDSMVDADLDHDGLSTQSSHKVDGSLLPAGMNNPPVITTTSPQAAAENTRAVAMLAATDADNDSLTWSKNGGADAGTFALTPGGVLTFATAPDFEHPTDAGTTNRYEVTVRVSDGPAMADLALTVTVTDVDEPPLAPRSPRVTKTDEGRSPVVTWSPPSTTDRPAITSYDLRYRAQSSSTWINGPQNVTDTSATITGLDANTDYEVQVRARNAEGEGPWSTEAAVPPPPDPDPPAPRPRPLQFTVTPGDRQLTVAWSAVPDADLYTVEWKTESQEYDGSRQRFVEPPEYVIGYSVEHGTPSLENGTPYTVRMRVRTEGGSSAWSEITSIPAPPPPPRPRHLTVTPGDRQLTVAWSAVPGADLYTVEWKTESQEYDGTRQRSVRESSTTISRLENGTPYTVRVRASTAGGSSAWSEEVTGTPTENPTPVPALPAAGAVGLGLLLLGAARRALRARGGR